MNPTLRALNGFGLGARPGERRRVTDAKGWLRAQLQGDVSLSVTPAAGSSSAIADAIRAFRTVGQGDEQERKEARQRARRALVGIAAAESHAALTERVITERPFVERLVAFWSNHLCVSMGAKCWSRRSPAATSAKPSGRTCSADSKTWSSRRRSIPRCSCTSTTSSRSGRPLAARALGGRGQGQRRGLNENYARELLELHTLGVDGGYTQQDVQELAKILTGWTVGGIGRRPGAADGARGAGRGVDAPARPITECDRLHLPGAAARAGSENRARRAIRRSRRRRRRARHPRARAGIRRPRDSSRRSSSTHFVSDEPPAAAVDRIARVFRDSDGDLKRRVARALIDLPEAWSDDARKFRTPQDWLVAVLRAFERDEVSDDGHAAAAAAAASALVAASAQGIRRQDAGMGGSRLAAESRRARAHDRAAASRRSGLDPAILLDVVDVPAGNPLHALLADSSIAADERIALALAGPAFQWR